MANNEYIAKIALPVLVDGAETIKTYYIKDSEARQMIHDLEERQLGLVISTNAANTPLGVEWTDGETIIVGTLAPSAQIHDIYLVPSVHELGHDIYDEYVCAQKEGTYIWEKLGDTDITLPDLDHNVINVSLALTYDNTLGEATTFTDPASNITITPTKGDFLTSITPTSQKLATTSIIGVDANTVTFAAVDTNTAVTATNTVFGTDTTASKVVPVEKTINSATATTTHPIKVQTSTQRTFAIRDNAATPVSRIAGNSNGDLLNSASVESATETLVIGKTSYTQANVTGTRDTATVTDYTFEDEPSSKVSTSAVTFNAISSSTDVTVPVVTSNASVTATNTATTSVTAAVKAANPTVVATGQLTETDANGDTVVASVSSSDAKALTDVTAVDPQHSITVGSNDIVSAVTDATITTTFWDGTVTHNAGRLD